MKTLHRRNSRGYTLIEVLIGILVFAIGMMALAQLQSHLARNSSDSNARTVAINIAEELIEQARVFSHIDSGGADITAYNDITEENLSGPITREGNVFEVLAEVTDYYYDFDSKEFTTDKPSGVAKSDFKKVDLTVTWNGNQEFAIDQQNQTEGRLGTGAIQISDVISSITSATGGKVALNASGEGSYVPAVDYNPGENPDIISIQLGANKFKESTTPLPDVIRSNELVETRFDVVTYSQSGDNATFLRREEFRALSCECTLRIPSTSDQGGLRPTVWNGTDYTEGQFVSKPYGEQANYQQSDFCGICCRDHHDGGSGTEDDPYDPGRSRYSPVLNSVGYYDSNHGGLQGDHLHFKRNRLGGLDLATQDGDTYLEACRMVRKDGFWRVAQNLRQEGFNSFPQSFLDDEYEVGLYSTYVTQAVTAYEAGISAAGDPNPTNPYEDSPPSLIEPKNAPTPLIVPGSSFTQYTEMAPDGVSEQQMRARGIYIDYMTDELRETIACLESGGRGAECGVPQVTTTMEIIPFYDVQLTWLARWTESPNNYPVDVMNEAIKDDNTHKRGIATLTSGSGLTTVFSAVHTGNLGLTGTDPIDLNYGNQTEEYGLWTKVLASSPKPVLSGITVAGSITSAVAGVRAADVEIEADGALCDRTLTGYNCAILSGAKSPWIAVTNYYKQNRTLLACSLYSGLADLPPRDFVATSGNNKSKFSLPTTLSTTVADIVIKENSCD